MRKQGANLNRYKFNYAVKGFLAFMAYNNYQAYKQASEENFLIEKEKSEFRVGIAASTGMFVGACLLF